MEDKEQVRFEIIKALIPTASYASLMGSAKSDILEQADMFVNYVFDTKATRGKAKNKPL